MKRSSSEIKRIARDMLNQRYRIPMFLFMITTFVPMLLELPFSPNLEAGISLTQIVVFALAEFLIQLIVQVLGAGAVYVHLNMTRGWEFKVSQILYPFRNGTDRFFGASFLLSLITLACCLPAFGGAVYFYIADLTAFSLAVLIVCSLVSIILSIVYSLHYAFTLYFLLDYPQMKVLDALRESKRLMKGNKGRLFYIQCSFLGWGILSFLSIAIASLWIEPYIRQTMVTFYLDCTEELNRIPVRDYGTPEEPHINPIY